jgi:hypothetical protein
MSATKNEGKVDNWFEIIEKYITKKIGYFVAFLFLLIAFGAFVGIIVTQRWPQYSLFTVIVPGIAGMLAYYNRSIAIALFALLMLFVFLI